MDNHNIHQIKVCVLCLRNCVLLHSFIHSLINNLWFKYKGSRNQGHGYQNQGGNGYNNQYQGGGGYNNNNNNYHGGY